MSSLFFWKNWPQSNRALAYFALALLSISILLMTYFTIQGETAVIKWEKLPDQKTIETAAHTFETGSFEFSIPIESFITFEFFQGGSLQSNLFLSYTYVVIVWLAILLLLAVASAFDKFWFLVSTGLFILVVVSMRPDVLKLFGISSQWITAGVIAWYVIPVFYFNNFRQHTSLSARFSTLVLLSVLLCSCIYFFGEVMYPFAYLSVSGYAVGLICCVLFILLIGNEIIAGFVYLTSQSTATSKSLRHFLIITVIYLTNLVLAYLYEANLIQWNFLFINVYLLLTISGVLILWGYKQREPIYGNIMPFTPHGSLFIICLATIAFITVASLAGHANDVALTVVRKLILFSHIGFGFIFTIYIISNFILMMAENLNVYKVLYKPTRMPYFTFRFAGFIAVLGFVFYSDWRDFVYKGFSGFYNELGDLYQLVDKRGFAEAYYKQAKTYSFDNHHANYVIAAMETNRNNRQAARDAYEYANYKRPTEFSLANEANLYLREGNIFKGISLLRNANNKKENSGPLLNNLGYALSKIHNLDSALLCFDVARTTQASTAAEINVTALIAQEYLPIDADSLSGIFNNASPATMANLFAVATIHQQPFQYQPSISNQQLTLYEATLVNNYMVHQLKQLDTAFIHRVHQLANDSVNDIYEEALKVTLAHAYYHKSNVARALELLGEMAYVSQLQQGEYNYIMGLWTLEQGNAALAASYFYYSNLYEYKDGPMYFTLALAEARAPEALQEAERLMQSERDDYREIGAQVKTILTRPLQSLSTDLEKYQYAHYRLALKDTTTLITLINTVSSDDYKAKMILEMAQRQFNAGNSVAAIQLYRRIENLKITDKKLFNAIQYFELLMLASRGEIRTLATTINTNAIEFDQAHQLDKLLYAALISEVSGDTATASNNYRLLAHYNPFFEEGVIAAARYFKQHSENELHAYTILAEAIHVNATSVRLNEAYIAEALRMGFDDYATGAEERLKRIKARL